jgi:acetylornithine deacetylase/succinyl-diaminopimelate desuccinylase-like protein
LLAVPALAVAQPISPEAAQKLAQGSFHEYLELLALPNDAINPADIQRNVDFLERAFKKRGFTTRQLDNKGKPMLYAEWPRKLAGAKTVLYYMHLDGQPVVDHEWSQPSPWKPVVKKRNAAGAWEIVSSEALFGQVLDPELRVFARSASDDKAPIVMFLAAFDGLKAMRADPAINVKVLLDSEEEKGSPTIRGVLGANKELLKCDALIIHDGPRHQSERPTIVFGNRGAADVTLTVYGPRQPLHSGHFGNYVPNPAVRLARLIASPWPATTTASSCRPPTSRSSLRPATTRRRSCGAPASRPPSWSAAASRRRSSSRRSTCAAWRPPRSATRHPTSSRTRRPPTST